MSQKESAKPSSSPPETHARKLLFFDSRFSESRTAPGVRTLTTFLSTSPFVFFGSPICSQIATFFPLPRSFDMWDSAPVEGDAAERHRVFLRAVPRGESYPEYFRRDLRVVVEHLVEIPEPEKEYRVGIFPFDT